MNKNSEESINLINEIKSVLMNVRNDLDVLVCPPFTSIESVSANIKNTFLKLGAQNCEYRKNGAFTGEISISMLEHLDVEYIISGHSERRAYYSETDEIINKKVNAILDSGLKAILCIGETLEQRKSGLTFPVLTSQLLADLDFNDKQYDLNNLIIAYEPVWAIGTGITASSEQIAEAHKFIRSKLVELFGDSGKNILIQYGGSVTAENAQSILEIDDVNGALIGGASLKSDSFVSIINSASKI